MKSLVHFYCTTHCHPRRYLFSLVLLCEHQMPHDCMFTAQGMPGVGNSPGPSLIPNGQPPQWNHPSALPHAVKPRPPSTGSHIATSITSNGTPTPPSYSHPGLLLSA